MPDNLQTLQDRASALKQSFSDRDEMYDAIEDMYNLVDEDLPPGVHIKKTISPAPRNALNGMTRIMGGGEPKWHVPPELNTDAVEDLSSKLERLASSTWTGSCRVQRKMVHKEAVLSAGMYSLVNIAVKSTKQLQAKAAQQFQKRAENAARRTPVLFEVLPARACYPEFDSLGLSGHLQFKKARAGALIAAYGTVAEEALAGKKSSELVDVSEWWDENNYAVWLGEAGEQLTLEENPYTRVPIAAVVCEGSELFQRTGQQQYQPLLYGLWKSGGWKRENLGLTVAATMVFSIGANMQLIYETDELEGNIDVDYSIPGGVWKIRRGDKVYPLSKNVIDPSLLTLMQKLDQIDEESTLFKQALGQPLGGNAPFSMVSLLSQSGRLPLVPYKQALDFCLGDAMQIAMEITREDGIPDGMGDTKGKIELDAAEIPEFFEIECDVQIDMPQDERQNAMIAIQLAGGDQPILSKETAAKRFLGIDQYDQEVKRIWNQRMDDLEEQIDFEIEKAKSMQRMQKLQQGGAQGGMPPGGPAGMPPPGGPPAPDQFGDLSAQMAGAPGAGLPALPMGGPMMPGEEGMPGNPMEAMQ